MEGKDHDISLGCVCNFHFTNMYLWAGVLTSPAASVAPLTVMSPDVVSAVMLLNDM